MLARILIASSIAIALLCGCSKPKPPEKPPVAKPLEIVGLDDAETQLASVMASRLDGAQQLHDEYHALDSMQIENLEHLERSGDYDGSRSLILSALASTVAERAAPNNYLALMAQAQQQCTQTEGNGHWLGSSGIGLSRFCDGVSDLVGLEYEKHDNPGLF